MGTAKKRGQPADGHIRRVGRHWSKPGALGAPGNWTTNLGMYGDYGGARASIVEANLQGWVRSELASQ